MRRSLFQSLKNILSAYAVPGALALKATVFMTLALNGWSDGRDHYPALGLVLISTGMLLFCLHVVMVRSRKTRRLAAHVKRNLRRADQETADGKSRLRSVGRIQRERDRDAAQLRAVCERQRAALLQERAELPAELETLKGQIQTALERFNGEVQTLRARSVNALRTALAGLVAVAALRHRLQPRVCGVRFNRERLREVTRNTEEEFSGAVNRLIASNQPKLNP